MSKLKDYIKEQKEKGFSDEEIRKALLDVGWGEDIIDGGFRAITSKVKKPPTTLISILFLLAAIFHLAIVPFLSLFGFVSWAFRMMTIFSIISSILSFICFIALIGRKSWYLKPFLMLFGMVFVMGLFSFSFFVVIQILILVIIFVVLWKQKEKFDYQLPAKFFQRWSFLIVGAIIGLILGMVFLAETNQWITPKWVEVREEVEMEREETRKKEVIPEDWGTYRNAEYGYQIDYPINWTIYDDGRYFLESGGLIMDASSSDVNIQTFSLDEIKKRVEKKDDLFKLGALDYMCAMKDDCVNLNIKVESTYNSLEEWIEKDVAQVKSNLETAKEQGFDWEYKEEYILLNNEIRAYEFIIWIPYSLLFPARHYVAFFREGLLYEITVSTIEEVLFDKYPKTIQQMISSFKFINQ
ncbi:MAG: hypothetical protein ABIA91_02000 [Patescibacteria group bacterium]